MKNIAIVLTDITRPAGTERAVVNLSNILADNLGYAAFIVSTDTTDGAPYYPVHNNVEILHGGLHVSRAKGTAKITEYVKLYRLLTALIADKRLDYVIGTYSTFNALITKCKRVKTIGCEHFNYDSASKIHNAIKRLFYKKLSRVVVLTHRDAQRYRFLSNVSVIPNSLSFAPKTQSDCMKKEIISVGRLVRQKGFDLLIEAAVMIKKRIPDWHITIYGEGPDKESLLNQIQKNQIQDFVTIKPYTKNIASVYQNAGMYVSSARWEGMPMVLLESQSCGLPAVAFDCPCGPSDIVINGKTGFVVELGDMQRFADCIVELAENEKERCVFGKNAAEASGRFSTEAVAQLWSDLLESL